MFSNRHVDLATELEQTTRDQAVAEIRARIGSGASAQFCLADGCGEEIPEARRIAVPGCRFCVACQAQLERRRG